MQCRGRRLGVVDRGPRRVGHRQVQDGGQPLGAAEHGDGERVVVVGERGGRRRPPQPGQQRRHLGVPAGDVELREGAGGVARRRGRVLRTPRAGCPRPAVPTGGAPSSGERRPLRPPRGRAGSGTSASRSPTAACPDSRARAARPGTAGRPRTSPGTGSTSRNRRSPSPRRALSAAAERDRLVGARQAADPVRGVTDQGVEGVVVGRAAAEPGRGPDREPAGGEVVHSARLRRRVSVRQHSGRGGPPAAPRSGRLRAWLRGCSG